MSWYVYLLSCADGSLYTGITREPRERLEAHNRGVGGAYTRSRLPVRLAYLEPAASRPEALRRELRIKALPRRRKLELVATRRGVSEFAPLLCHAGLAAPHGFSTRLGGVSEGPFESLNLGSNTGDDPLRVSRNREIFRKWFAVDDRSVSLLEQVHGRRVVPADPDRVTEADGQVTDDPSQLLVIASADCLPLLFHDPVSGAVGAAHCGWRGTLAKVAAETVTAMSQEFGSDPRDIRVAIGPGICHSCYQVGKDVAGGFSDAGFPERVLAPDGDEHWRLDLVGANVSVLLAAGVPARSIFRTAACTHCDGDRFFSHRRDRGTTGRHWAAIKATAPAGKKG